MLENELSKTTVCLQNLVLNPTGLQILGIISERVLISSHRQHLIITKNNGNYEWNILNLALASVISDLDYSACLVSKQFLS